MTTPKPRKTPPPPEPYDWWAKEARRQYRLRHAYRAAQANTKYCLKDFQRISFSFEEKLLEIEDMQECETFEEMQRVRIFMEEFEKREEEVVKEMYALRILRLFHRLWFPPKNKVLLQ